MDKISDKDKLGIAILSEEASNYKKKMRVPEPRPQSIKDKSSKPSVETRKKITTEDIRKGIITPGDANDEMIFGTYKNGGLVDRRAIRGKTRGKIC
jgi:hypothetical protein